MSEPRYRWSHPAAWLLEKLQQAAAINDCAALFEYAQTMAVKLDSDTIQDIFQPDMDTDGYFEPLPLKEGESQ